MLIITYIITTLTKLFLGLASLVLDALHPHPQFQNLFKARGGWFLFISVFDVLAKDEEIFICYVAAATSDVLYEVDQVM